ncbi:MAG: helix-turn-helix transcriptional regulator, partial [Bacilli bacterium]
MQTKDVIHDLLIIKQILGISDSILAKELGVSRSTLNRWVTGESTASQSKVQSLYTYAYKR